MKKWQKRMILVAGASLLAYAAHENYRKQQEQKEPRPESLTGTALLHGLVAHADEEITVKQAVDRFEEMSRLPVDHPSPVDPETDDLLCEVGTYDFGDGPFFYFSLARQFKTDRDADEYRQLRLDMLFAPEEGTKEFSDVIWSEEGQAGFADFWKEVRDFAPYRYLCENGKTAVKTLVRLEET